MTAHYEEESLVSQRRYEPTLELACAGRPGRLTARHRNIALSIKAGGVAPTIRAGAATRPYRNLRHVGDRLPRTMVAAPSSFSRLARHTRSATPSSLASAS